MSAPLTFKDRLLAVIVPTKGQAAWAIVCATAISVLGQTMPILSKLGVNENDVASVNAQFHDRFDVILKSGIASQLAVITFWAVVGLVAYLVCWGAYNALIEARNEVTLNTAYTNRGHWRGPYQTLGLKAAAAIGLAIVVGTLWIGVSAWVSAVGQVIDAPSILSILLAIVAVLSGAIHLYAILALGQLTFTPWYRAEAFTEE